MNSVALRAVWSVQSGSELHGRNCCEIADWPQLFAFWDDPINSAFIFAGADVELRQPLWRNPAGMLDHEAIHIYSQRSAIGSGAGLHRTKPVVAGGEKFRLLFVLGAEA